MDNIKITRASWAWILIIANAVSMAMMYAMQGILVAGENIDKLPWWFWPADVGGWMVRSIVESFVVFYLFRTESKNAFDKFILAFFEISLVILIMATQGPALYALTSQLPIAETMSANALRLWTAGLGTYGALMLAAAGVAYKIQPADVETLTIDEHNVALADERAQHALEQSTNKRNLQAKAERVLELELDLTEIEYLRQWKAATQEMKTHTVAGVSELIGFLSNGKPPKAGKIADLLGATRQSTGAGLEAGAQLRRQIEAQKEQ